GDAWDVVRLTEDLPLETDPRRLLVRDLDGDGDDDLLAIAGRGREIVTIVSGEPDGGDDAESVFEVMSRGIGPGTVDPEAVALLGASYASSPVYIAGGAFARVLQLTAEGWEVAEQINGRSGTDYRVIVPGDFDGAGGPPEVAVVDRGSGRVSLQRRGVDSYEVWRDVELGGFSVVGSAAVDLDGDACDDVLLIGEGSLAVLYSGRGGPTLTPVTGYDPADEDVFYFDSVAGDLNGDGYIDVALFDGRDNEVRVLDVDPRAGARAAVSWRLFEEKSFSREGGRGMEPRESAIADVTGDGLADLVLLIHDRLLVYPQQAAD
ncbi:MAG: VCBS repeat-containing protein, partial [Planctomycetota bacterium]